jgi:sodium/hydrogen exchanger-like protein 3
MFGSMARIGGENLIAADYTKSISSFFIVAFGGIGIGIIWAAATGFTTK